MRVKVGERRTRRIFLFLPRWLDGEFRWLRWVNMVSEFESHALGGTGSEGDSMAHEYVWVEIGYAEYQDE